MSVTNSETGATSAQILFTMSRKSTSEIDSNNAASTGTEDDANSVRAEIDTNSVETGNAPDTILCLLWNNGIIGAAYFNIITQQVIVLNIIFVHRSMEIFHNLKMILLPIPYA